MSAGDSKIFLSSGAVGGALRFQRKGVAPLHAPSPFSPPLIQRVEEPVAHEGSAWILRRFAVLECSGWGGWGGRGGRDGTLSADVGDLLLCERSGDGLSCSPPAQPLQADTMRELMVVEDVLLQSMFPELLPAGASGGPLPFAWWPTQTNRQGDGGPRK